MPVCRVCAAPNDEGSAFCEECGSSLTVSCPSCGAPATPGKRFCRACGAALSNAPAAAASVVSPSMPGSAVPAPVAERRVCSVLFCDLVGFTPLSEARDPEEVRELLSRYFDAAKAIIGRYGGVVEKFIGDAVMAVWGTPSATEQDGERAVRAALDVVDAVRGLGRDAAATGLTARAGVVTGQVAVTVGATGEGMVAGDAVNTAARVQAAADPGTVLVDEGTRRVAEAAVSFVSAGEHVVKGKAAPVPLWRADRVLSGVGGSQRIDGLEAPFVGRDAELRLVKELFHACAERRVPRLVSVTGAAGVGKSRLGWEFEKYADGLADTVWWHRGRCLSYGDGVAFWALAEMVRQRFGIAEEDASAVAADKLVAGLARWLSDPDERAYVAARFGQLLGVDVRAPGPPLPREELFAGWRLFFQRLAGQGTVVLVVEDLHYADPGLLDFLEHLLDWTGQVPIFVLTLARPEVEARRAGWGTGRRNSTTLTLDPLDDPAMDVLLDGLVPGLPVAAKSAIADRAEGIPLYAVETVRMLIDRDVVQPIDGVYRLVGDVGELKVPATLRSLLAARLDALEPAARRLVAEAAVLGGSFPAEALLAVSDQPEQQVRRLLDELVRREVLGVRADPLSPERGQYGFVQTMFRQVAYDTLSRRERKARHLSVAAHLQTVFADGGEEVAEVIAAHLIDALTAVPDDPDVTEIRGRAVATLTRAGERAERTGAPAAAASAFDTAADLVGHAGGPDSEVAAARLWERAGKALEYADFETAAGLFRRAADMYRRHQLPRDAARAETGVGGLLQRLGRHEEARSTLQQALTVLEVEPQADTVDALACMARLEAFAGNLDAADRWSSAALAEAQALALPDATLADLFTNRGLAHVIANRPAQAAMYYREAVRCAEAAQASPVALRARVNLAEVLLAIDPPAALDTARTAMAQARHLGSRWVLGVAQCNLLEGLLLTGGWDEAEQLFREEASADEGRSDSLFAYGVVRLRAVRGDSGGVSALMPLLQLQADTEDPQELAVCAVSAAATAACEGNAAEALSQADRALGYAGGLGLGSDAIWWAWPIAADSALALGDLAEATRLVGWLDDHRLGDIPPLLRAERLRIRARLLAAAAAAADDPQTLSAFDAAVNALREFGSPYHLAAGLLDQAEYLAASAGVADGGSEVAHRLAAEAGVIARRLGARPLVDRVHRVVGSGAQPETVAAVSRSSAG